MQSALHLSNKKLIDPKNKGSLLRNALCKEPVIGEEFSFPFD